MVTVYGMGGSVLFRAAVVLVLLGTPIAAFLWLPAIGDPSPEALQYSVAREVGANMAFEGDTCRRVEPFRWRCGVLDRQASGTVVYRVTLDGRCWQAVKRRNGEEGKPLAKRASGCVRWRDQLRLYQRVL
jgi:hypothetical protein